MMKSIRKSVAGMFGIASAAALLFAAMPAATADDTLVNEFTNAEVNEALRNNEEVKGYACDWMQWPLSNICRSFADRGANGGMIPAFEEASDRGCGVRQTVDATGSGSSYDKAEFSYELIDCP